MVSPTPTQLCAQESADAEQSHPGFRPANSTEPRGSSSDPFQIDSVKELGIDVFFLEHNGRTFVIPVSANDVRNGTLIVQTLKDTAALRLNISNVTQLRLFHKGQELIDDGKACRDYGLKHESEVQCCLTEDTIASGTSDDDLVLSMRNAGLQRSKGDRGPRQNMEEPAPTELAELQEDLSKSIELKAGSTAGKMLSNAKYDWKAHFPTMVELYRRGVSIPKICAQIQNEAEGFTPK
jgi:hypothetical protein